MWGGEQAICEYTVDRGVLPIENSLAGSLHSVYDLMLRYQLHVVGEVTMQVCSPSSPPCFALQRPLPGPII